ncbi:MAG: flagellar hook-associated protein FlgK [Planctomycetota bacterium]
MSLVGTLNAAKSALAVTQTAIQTTGNNVSNANTEGYSRQSIQLTPSKGQRLPGGYVGRGVDLLTVQRQVDDALEARLRASISDEAGAAVRTEWLNRIEVVIGELSDTDLSTAMSEFFNSWSELANKPQDQGLRQVVLQSGKTLADKIQQQYTELQTINDDAFQQLRGDVDRVESLLQQVAEINGQIEDTEGVGGIVANDLRDVRDNSIRELAELINARGIVRDDGTTDVYVGSELLVAGNRSFGVQLSTEEDTGLPRVSTLRNDAKLDIRSGRIGGLLAAGEESKAVRDDLDDIAGALIFDVNRIHAAGQGTKGLSEVEAGHAVADTTVPLNDPLTELGFTPNNGSFVVNVTERGTGLTTSTLLDVDLDGLGTDTSLDDLAAALDAVAGIGATVNNGRLSVTSDGGDLTFNFAEDSSGVLGALGVNRFFDGDNAFTIGINDDLNTDPTLLAAASNGAPGDNGAARAIAAVQNVATDQLDGFTLSERYEKMTNRVAGRAADTAVDAQSASITRQTLQAQREALSGVSLDEEATNLLRYQQAYQAAARVIAVVDELMDSLIAIV